MTLTADWLDICFRKEEESRHRSKHKKTKKVKEEPVEEEDNAIPTIKSERQLLDFYSAHTVCACTVEQKLVFAKDVGDAGF